MGKLINLTDSKHHMSEKNSVLEYLLLPVKILFLEPNPLLIMNYVYLPISTVKKLDSLETGSFV